MVEFGEYGFIKWKFKFWNFLSENLKSEFSEIFYGIFWWLFRKVEDVSIFDKVKIWNLNFLEFSTEFSGDYSERLKRFQSLTTVLWKNN